MKRKKLNETQFESPLNCKVPAESTEFPVSVSDRASATKQSDRGITGREDQGVSMKHIQTGIVLASLNTIGAFSNKYDVPVSDDRYKIVVQTVGAFAKLFNSYINGHVTDLNNGKEEA